MRKERESDEREKTIKKIKKKAMVTMHGFFGDKYVHG